jgi:hypothetical protein
VTRKRYSKEKRCDEKILWKEESRTEDDKSKEKKLDLGDY